MKQNIFETRQKAEEMMSDAIKVWQKSEKSEYLEGLETDPVFKLMMNAIAYQSNELASELETMKEEVVREFVRHSSSEEGVRAVPATMLVRMTAESNVPAVPLTGEETFTVSSGENTEFSFMPLLKTTVYNLKVKSVNRLDLRRWSVNMEFPAPVSNLSGMAFSIEDASFRSLKVSIPSRGCVLPLISPEDFQNLPVSDMFSLKTLMFNRMQAVDTADFRADMTPYSGHLAMELFARTGSGFFLVDRMPDFEPSSHLEFIFEFDGVSGSFDMHFNKLHVNTAIMVNAEKNTASLSKSKPVHRLTGSEGTGGRSRQFLQLLPGGESSASTRIRIRRVCADRFNAGRLFGLLQNLVSKFHSDFYAFQSIGTTSTDGVVMNIRKSLDTLMQRASAVGDASFEGVYAILDENHLDAMMPFGRQVNTSSSIDVNYLTTDGAAANVLWGTDVRFVTPQGILPEGTAVVGAPEPGFDEIRNERQEQILMRYYSQTRDRLVTLNDIKLFCVKELYVHFNVPEEMVDTIHITRRPKDMGTWHTYEISVDIVMKPNDFVRKAFGTDNMKVENYLQKMAQVRTAGMYPIRVKFTINE